jgi:hypothetical protein
MILVFSCNWGAVVMGCDGIYFVLVPKEHGWYCSELEALVSFYKFMKHEVGGCSLDGEAGVKHEYIEYSRTMAALAEAIKTLREPSDHAAGERATGVE